MIWHPSFLCHRQRRWTLCLDDRARLYPQRQEECGAPPRKRHCSTLREGSHLLYSGEPVYCSRRVPVKAGDERCRGLPYRSCCNTTPSLLVTGSFHLKILLGILRTTSLDAACTARNARASFHSSHCEGLRTARCLRCTHCLIMSILHHQCAPSCCISVVFDDIQGCQDIIAILSGMLN